jgi:tetratricopeptide (TPR) repeat protein
MGKNILFCILFFLLGGIIGAQTKPDALDEYLKGNYERAVEICKSEIAENARNMDAYAVICWSLIRLARYQEALQHARAGWNVSRYDPRIIEILGEISYYEGHNIEALQYFQEYVNLAPEGQRIETVYYFIGEIYIRQGRYHHADIALSTAVHYQPSNAAWLTRLAYAQENAGDLQQAIASYERALNLNSQLSDAQRGIERSRQALRTR